METSCAARKRQAFALTELVVIVLMVALLFVLLIPTLFYAKQKSQRIGCVNNLKNVGLAFRIWGSRNSDLFPMQVIGPKLPAQDSPTATRHKELIEYYQALSNELGTPRILACPADDLEPASAFSNLRIRNVSYFIGLDADGFRPGAFLAGDRNLTIDGRPAPRGVVDLTTNTVMGWTKDIHRFQGNVALGDGSVQQLTQARLNALMGSAGVATNRIIIP